MRVEYLLDTNRTNRMKRGHVDDDTSQKYRIPSKDLD